MYCEICIIKIHAESVSSSYRWDCHHGYTDNYHWIMLDTEEKLTMKIDENKVSESYKDIFYVFSMDSWMFNLNGKCSTLEIPLLQVPIPVVCV